MHAGSLTGFCAVYHDISDRLRTRDTLENKIGIRTRQLRRSRAETLHKLALAAGYRDDDTFQHTERVGAGAAELATRLGLPGSLVRLIRHAAPLHDVGKIGIPDRILLKPGPLNPEEFAAIKQHTVLGAELLSGCDSAILQLAEQIALTHHERWDGDGYPAGLAAEAIPIAGRIVAVVDSFDAMTNDRPYRAASSVEDALSEIARCSGTQFDPRVVKAFLHLHHRGAAANRLRATHLVAADSSPRAQTPRQSACCQNSRHPPPVRANATSSRPPHLVPRLGPRTRRQLGVGALDELGGAVARPERGEADFDRHWIGVGREHSLDGRKAPTGVLNRRAGHCAQKLITADANDQVIWTQMGADPAHCVLEHPVAGGMTVDIVDSLQADDVDIGNHERSARSASTIDLVVKFD